MRSKFVSLVLLLILCLGCVIPAFADTYVNADENSRSVHFIDSGITPANVLASMNAGRSSSTSDFESGKIKFDSSGNLSVVTKGDRYRLLQLKEGEVVVYPSAFSDANSADVSKAMRLFTDGVSNSSNDSAVVQELFNGIQEADNAIAPVMLSLAFDGTNADLYSAYEILHPGFAIVNKVLGVLVIVVLFILLLSTAIDFVYMGVPIARENMQNKAEGNGKSKPFGVSHEAYSCVLEVEKSFGSDGGYKNIYLLYAKRRIVTYILLPVCLLYFCCGGLSGIVGGLLYLVSGFSM